jgi:hypothetical protein
MSDERKMSTSDIAAAMDRRDQPVAARVDTGRPDLPVTQTGDDSPAPLFAGDELTGYRTRWSGIQTGFVDEPRRAVAEADTLVAEVIKRLAEVFAEERTQLEAHWEHAEQVSTEDLRIAMRRYRSFFERLLAI